MAGTLYDIQELKKHIQDDSEVPHHIANFIVNIAEESCNDLLGSYLKKENELSRAKAEKLKMSLSMFGVHAIEKDIDKLHALLKDSDSFQTILPVMNRIKSHLRMVKKQMLKDFKMVITLVN